MQRVIEPWTLFTVHGAKDCLNVRLRLGDPEHIWHSGAGVTCYWFMCQPFAVSCLSLRRIAVAGCASATAAIACTLQPALSCTPI